MNQSFRHVKLQKERAKNSSEETRETLNHPQKQGPVLGGWGNLRVRSNEQAENCGISRMMKRKGRGDGNVHTRGRGVFKHQKQVQAEEKVKNADVTKTESALSRILRQSNSRIFDVCDDSMGHSRMTSYTPVSNSTPRTYPRSLKKVVHTCIHLYTNIYSNIIYSNQK